MLGSFDTKEEDFSFLHSCLVNQGCDIVSINLGVRGTTKKFRVDFEADVVAERGGHTYVDLKMSNDRSKVVSGMGAGGAAILKELFENRTIQGVIGMGGGGGTYMVLKAMQTLPIGFPKICISTVATKDISRQVGSRDILLMPSVVDIAGLNKISRMLMNQAAAAISAMAKIKRPGRNESTKTIAISIFGNTTKCVNQCSEILKSKGYEVLTFHAVGSGGRSMESLISEGWIEGVLDITTTELADELCGGICSAGPDRMTAASEKGIPQVIVPGCLDMVNFGHMDTVPEQYRDRLLYSWAPDVTLMRTNKKENRKLGTSISKKLNQSQGRVAVLIPTKGISIISSDGGPFHAPDVDEVLFQAISDGLNESIECEQVDYNINDTEFAEIAVNRLLGLMGESL